MKKLKRRLTAALRGDRNSSLLTPDQLVNHHPGGGSSGNSNGGYVASTASGAGLFSMPYRTWSLSDSMSQLADRLAADGVIIEELPEPRHGALHHQQHHASAAVLRHHRPPPDYACAQLRHQKLPPHHYGHQQPIHPHPPPPYASSAAAMCAMRGKTRAASLYIDRHSTHSYYGSHASVVQESSVLGSDGESVEVSPCASDQISSANSLSGVGGGGAGRYVVNVKMRQKPSRKWSEEEIQKRLSLPADLRLPLSVVEKLNRTPTLDQPLTRKNRRASLSEIGFGKLETYEKLEKLGEGTYATVFRGRSLLTNKFVALKEIRLEQEEGAPCTAIREVSLLRNLRHANVVTLHDIIHTDRLLTLVFEYVDRDLKQYMDSVRNTLALYNVRLFLLQLLRGLAYCHQRRVLHRDLKPQNLLITSKGELKLADFGLARSKSVPTKTYSNEVVTLWYRPPDVLLGSTDYSTHIDMWGVGCILFEMAAGRALFPGSTPEEQLALIFRSLGSPSPSSHPSICSQKAYTASFAERAFRPDPLVSQLPRLDRDGQDLLVKFLQYEGRERMSARDALSHPFLRSHFPPAVFSIPDDESVLNVTGVHLATEPGAAPPGNGRSGAAGGKQHSKKERRRSLFL